MNFYNPFKPHIVENGDGTYSVRRFAIPHFYKLYLQKDTERYREAKFTGFFWWHFEPCVNRYCKYTKEEVLQVFEDYQTKAKEISNRKPVSQVTIKELTK